MTELKKAEQSLEIVFDYLNNQDLGELGSKAFIELDKALDIVKNLIIADVSNRRELCEGNCGMNYCDENGCVDNKPKLGEPKPPEHCC